MKRWLLIFVAIASVLLLTLIGLRWLGQKAIPEATTDPAQYANVFAEFHRTGYPQSSHLPSSIPPSATNVQFFYDPGALQGAMQLQLRYHLPPSQVQSILRDAVSRPTSQ